MKTVNLTGYVLDEEGNIYGKSGKSNRVLPDEDIKLIKIYVRHKIPSVILSEFYNISQQTICDIKKGRRWADV